MSADDEAYYQRRAEEEVERARRSTDPRIVDFHYRLTELYLDKVHGAGPGEGGRERRGRAAAALMGRGAR